MANVPLLNCKVNITAKDVNGNNVAKQFNTVISLMIDYERALINIVDATGSFYFAMSPVTTFTYTIVANPGGQHTLTIS